MNPNPSDPFPPRPDFTADRVARRARRRMIRYVLLGAFLAIGVALVLAHRYTAGFLFLGWGVLRLGMLGYLGMRRRRQVREWGSQPARRSRW
jgi:hypothetical protein